MKGSNENQLRKGISKGILLNLSSTVASNVVYTAMQWLSLMSLLTFGGVSQAGAFTLGLAISGPIFQFFGMQLRAGQATDHKADFDFFEYAQFRLKTSTLAMFFASVAALFVVPNIKVILFLIAASKFVESFSDLCYGVLQRKEEMLDISRSILLRSLMGYGAFITSFYFTRQIVFSLIMLVLIWLVVLLFHDIPRLPKGDRQKVWPEIVSMNKTQFEREKAMLLKYLPLGMIIGINSVSSNVPTYLLAYYNTIETVGIYSTLSYVITGFGIVAGALNQNLLPKFSRYYSDGDFVRLRAQVNKQVAFLVASGTLVSLGILTLGPLLARLNTHFDSDFDKPTFALLGICIITTLISSAFGNAITAMRVFFGQLHNNIISLAALLVSGLILIPEQSIRGAFLSIIIAMSLQIFLKSRIFYAKTEK